MKLSNFCEGRDNNFNLIRFIAALVVLLTHSFVLATGSDHAEPFQNFLGGMTMGTISVNVFFITSGFLVTASLLKRQSAIDFIWARALRIYPALLVMLLLTIFMLGVYFTTLPLSSYFSDKHTYRYLAKCSTLLFGVVYDLPGVFDGNPYKNAVNGSLWSMTPEIRMYAILAITWLVLKVAKESKLKLFKAAIVTYAVASCIFMFSMRYIPRAEEIYPQLIFMFFNGAAFYVLKEYISLHRGSFWLCTGVLLLVTIAGNKEVFNVIYPLTIAYILFYLAYVPGGFIRKYNQLGDYSYGIYIYAFPVQQSVAASQPGISVIYMILISGVVTIALSVLSWHLLEKRALGLKGRYIGHTRKLLGFIRTTGSTRSR